MTHTDGDLISVLERIAEAIEGLAEVLDERLPQPDQTDGQTWVKNPTAEMIRDWINRFGPNTSETTPFRSDRYPHIATWATGRLLAEPLASVPMNVLYADYASCMQYDVIDAVTQDTLTTELLEIIPNTHLVRGSLNGVAFRPGVRP